MKKVKDFILSHSDMCLFLCVAIMVFLRFVFCGFSYAYQGDDYIQYHNYATSDDYLRLIREQGLFSSRPLAIILDLGLYSPLWSCCNQTYSRRTSFKKYLTLYLSIFQTVNRITSHRLLICEVFSAVGVLFPLPPASAEWRFPSVSVYNPERSDGACQHPV